jgi:PAS domain S-box-containing protein
VIQSRAIRRFGLVLPLAFLVAVAVISAFGLGEAFIFSPQGLILVLHTIFLTGIGIVIAIVSARSYLRQGNLSILLLGAAVLILAVVGLLGGILLSNYGTIINNIGICASSAVQVVSAIVALVVVKSILPVKRKIILAAAYLGVVAFITTLTAATFSGIMPVFLTPQGPTLIRTIVLGLTVFLFASSCVLFFWRNQKSKAKTLYWYSLALGLFAIAFLSFMLQTQLADTFGWIGRLAEYSGSIFFIVALLQPSVKAEASADLSERWAEAFKNNREQVDDFFSKMLDGFAYFKILLNKEGKPVDFVFLDINEAFEKLTGLSKNNVLGKKASEIMNSDVLEDWLSILGPVALTGEPVTLDHFSKFSEKWVHLTLYSPQKSYLVSISEDISERKKAEEALRESRAKLQVAFASMTEAIFIADAEGNIVDFNDEFVRYHRFKDKDECSRNIADCPKYLDVWFADGTLAPVERWAMARALRGEIGSNVEYRLRRRETGETWWGSYNFSPIKDAVGKIVGAVVAGRDITEQKKAEEALKDSGERLQHALEAGELGLWGLDVITGKAWRTLQHDKIFGYNSLLPEWTYQMFLSHVLPEDRAMVDEKFGGAISKGTEWNFECCIQRPDGQRRWIWAQGRPKFDEKHAVVQMIGLVKDITERKKAEEALKESEKTFLELIERAPFGIYVINSQFRIAQMNKGSQNGAFINVRPIIGRDFSEAMHILWPEPTASEILSHFRHTLETGEPYYSPEFIHPRHDVEIVEAYEWELQRIKLPDGQYGVICYYFDSTKLRETERGLSEAQAKLKEYAKDLERLVEERTKKLEISSLYARNLIEASLDPLVTISVEGKITDVNKATEIVTDCSREQLIGSDFSDYFSEPEKANAGYKQVFKEGFVRDYPLSIKIKSGKITNVLYNATVYTNEEGKIQGVFAAARDVTELKKAEEQAQDAAKKLKDSERLAAIGATAGMVGHDIRNPLQAIVGDIYFTKKTLNQLPDSEQKQSAIEDLDAIEKNVDYINKIVQDLQDYARPLNPKAQETNIKTLLNQLLSKNEIPQNIKVDVKVEEKAEKIMADPDYVKRIFANLTLNAIQAMPNGGKLTIRAYADEQSNDVLITVKDTGVGIPEDVKPKLFTPMMTTKSKGQGFGLAVVKRMTEGLGGTVTFESQEGKGTTFKVRLPPQVINGK